MRLTGTFLDEITFDIPHQNWGHEEWDRDFRAMKALGIKRVFLIRAAWRPFMTFDSKVISATGTFHKPAVDLIDLFLDLAEKHDIDFYAGTWHSQEGDCVNWTPEKYEHEIAINNALVDEIWAKYGHRKAFKGWYLTHEVCANVPGTIDLFKRIGLHAKEVSGGLPTMISPYFAGVKAPGALGDIGVLTVEAHAAHWAKIFAQLRGAVDYVAFQDGHVGFAELADYLKVTAKLARENGITCWTNIESFDRDMPINFLPINWEKFLWKMEAAEAAGIEEGISFEFSHFISPNSMYPSAAGLYDRYCEYCGIPARAKDFKN